MSRVKTLSFIAIGMMVINLAILVFLFAKKPGQPKREGPRKMVIEMLHLDKSQVAQYDELINQHKKEIEIAQEKLMGAKNKLFNSLRSDEEGSDQDALIQEIGALQIEIEQIHYAHFQQLKAICKPDQLKAFDELCLEIARLFAPPPPGRR